MSEPPVTVVSIVQHTVVSTAVSTVEKTVTMPAKPAPTPLSTTSAVAPVNGSVKPAGQAFDFNVVKVSVLDVKIPMMIGSHEPDAGNQFAGVLAQMCIQHSSAPTHLTWGPWNLEGADGGQYPAAESAYEDTPKPEYPFSGEATFVNGDCAKGWIMFQLPQSAKPVHVRYSVSDPDFGPLLGLWAIKS